jgi:hypothetical protein
MRHMLAFFLVVILGGVAAFTADSQSFAIPGLRGAIPIPFTLEKQSTVSVGVYSPEGQALRFLIQGVELPAGDHRIDWDGLDMWGRLLPAGTQVETKVYHHTGIQAFYEFALGADDWDPNSRPWASIVYGEGDDMRCGGWVSDHKGPSSIAVAGDRVVVGASGAEAGDSVVILNLDGVKMDGRGGLGGFGGWAPAPKQMWSDDDDHVMIQSGSSFWRLNVRDVEFKKVGSVKGRMYSATVFDGEIHTLSRPLDEGAAALPMMSGTPNTKQSDPQVLGTETVQFQQSPVRRFQSTLRNSSHFQTGISVKNENGFGHLVIPYNKAVTLGSVVIPQIKDAGLIEVFVLNPGIKYDQFEHHPLQNTEEEKDDFMDLNMTVGLSGLDVSDVWTKFGDTRNRDRLNLINAPESPVQTHAILLRISQGDGSGGGKKKKGRVKSYFFTHILPYTKRQRFVGRPRVVISRSDIKKNLKRFKDGWDFVSDSVPNCAGSAETGKYPSWRSE